MKGIGGCVCFCGTYLESVFLRTNNSRSPFFHTVGVWGLGVAKQFGAEHPRITLKWHLANSVTQSKSGGRTPY